MNDTERLKYHGDQFYLKTDKEMAAVFPDYVDAMRRTVDIAARCNVDLSFKENYLPNFDVPAGFTLDDYFEHEVRRGFQTRLPQLQDLAAARHAEAHHRRVRAAAVLRNRHDQEDEVPGLLHDRVGLHPLRARAGHPGRSGPRLRRRQP